MNLGKRVEQLEQAMQRATAPPTVVTIGFVVSGNRAEVAALEAYDQAHPEPPPSWDGPVELRKGKTITAGEYLRQHGVVWPPAETPGGDTAEPADVEK